MRVASRIACNAAWLGGGEVVLKGALFAAGVLVARGLGRAAMGTFTVGYDAALVLMLVLAAGQAEVLIRETARRPGAGRALRRLANAWQLRVALVMIPLAAVGSALVSRPLLRWTLLAFIPYAALRSRLVTAGAVFKGLDRMDVEVMARALELTLVLVLLVPLAALKGPVWVSGLIFAVGAAAGLVFVRVRLRALAAGEAGAIRGAFLAREGAWFLGLSLSGQLLMRVGTFLLALFGVSAEEIGSYGVAAAPVWGLLAAAQLLAVAAYPTLTRQAADGTLGVWRVLVIGASGAALGGVLASGLYLIRTPLIDFVFGAQYLGATRLLAVLVWALPGACAAMVLGVAIAACGRQIRALVFQALLVALAVVANALLIPRHGTAGAVAVAVGIQCVNLVAMATIAALAAARPSLPLAVPPAWEWE
jgi:PST family polysaccharide transporter